MAEEKKEETKTEVVPTDKPLASVEADAKKQEADAALPPNTRPEEKEMAEKLMAELKSQGVDVNALNKDGGGVAETAEATLPPVDETKTDPLTAEKKKRFKLPSLFKKKSATPAESESTSTSAPNPTSDSPPASEEIKQMVKEFELASELERNINKSTDLWVFRIKKSTVLLFVGLLVVLMWLVPIVSGVKLYLNQKGITFSLPLGGEKDSPTASDSAQITPTGPKIRIRDASKQDGVADRLTALLKTSGFENVEIAFDSEGEYEGVSLITKPGKDALRQGITAALAAAYTVASPSAELTADSDFEAVILLGKNARQKTEVKGEATESGELETKNGLN